MKRALLISIVLLAAIMIFGLYCQFFGHHTEGRTAAALRNFESYASKDQEILNLIAEKWPSPGRIDAEALFTFLSGDNAKSKGGVSFLMSLPQWGDQIGHDSWGMSLLFAIVQIKDADDERNELRIWSMGRNHLDENATGDDIVARITLPHRPPAQAALQVQDDSAWVNIATVPTSEAKAGGQLDQILTDSGVKHGFHGSRAMALSVQAKDAKRARLLIKDTTLKMPHAKLWPE